MIIGGFFDEITGNDKGWIPRVQIGHPTVEYFNWAEQSHDLDYVMCHLKRHLRSQLIVVGHSYGGDSAMDLASALNRVDPGISVHMLVTLDPTSRFPPIQ